VKSENGCSSGVMLPCVIREFCYIRIYHFIYFTYSVMLVFVVLSSARQMLCFDTRRIFSMLLLRLVSCFLELMLCNLLIYA